MSSVSRFLVPPECPDLHQSAPLNGHSVLVPVFVDLRPYGIGYAVARYPVTNTVYVSHLEAVSRKNLLAPRNNLLYTNDRRFNGPNHPVVGVNYRDALGYCEWLSARFSEPIELPDAATWERIASCNRKKVYSTMTDQCTHDYVNFGLEVGATTPVNAYPPNEFGLYDMTGNVLEWTSSIPSPSDMRPEYGAMPVKSEKDLAQQRILKGGNWAFDAANSRISATIVFAVTSTYYVTGFRPVIRLG